MWPRKTKNGNWRFVDTFKNPQTNKWQEVSVTLVKIMLKLENKLNYY